MLKTFKQAPESQQEVDTITLDSIDLSKFKYGDEFINQRKALAAELQKSITTTGFFYLINYGVSSATVKALQDIAYTVLTLPEEEQQKYLAGALRKEWESPNSVGGERAQGYKPKGYWGMKGGIRDSIIHYNFRNTYHDQFLVDKESHPQVVGQYIQEIADYFNTIHREVLVKLLSLCDLILEVPEGTLLKNYFKEHGTNKDDSNSHGRFMLYEPYDEDASVKTANTWLTGHSDISGFSFITSQPIISLQVRDYYSGEWKYVKHKPDALIVNIGDAMEFISGGLFKACLHRVIEPPIDQKQYQRLALIYFCNPSATADLDPDSINSPFLKRLGLTREQQLNHWEKIQFHHWNYTKGQTLGGLGVGDLQFFGRTIERNHASWPKSLAEKGY